MLRWHVPKLPIVVSRGDFVRAVFAYGGDMDIGCDTLLTAVQLGDSFVASTATGYLYHLNLHYKVAISYPETVDLVQSPVPRVYSKELAYVVVSLACKAYEEDFSLQLCVIQLENNYLVKMEWEVYTALNCDIPRKNIGTWIADMFPCAEGHLSRTFHRLALAIALDPKMMQIPPATIILACKLLHRRKVLRPQVESRQIFLIELFMSLARNYEVSMSQVIRGYIQCHTGNDTPQ